MKLHHTGLELLLIYLLAHAGELARLHSWRTGGGDRRHRAPGSSPSMSDRFIAQEMVVPWVAKGRRTVQSGEAGKNIALDAQELPREDAPSW
jgi:hypothetical protein